jgi:hypothetical protein
LSDWIDIQVWFIAAGLACMGAGVVLLFIPSVIHIEDQRAEMSASQATYTDHSGSDMQ